MRRSHPGIAFPIVRITLLIMVVACMASSMFASSGSRSLAFTSGGTSDLALQESDNPDPVWPDGIVTYTLTVTNNGPDNTDANLNGYICVGRFCNAGKVGPPRNVASSSQATFIDYTSTDPFWTCNIDPGVTQTPLSLNCSTNSTFVGTPPTTSTITIHLQAPSQEDVINSNFSVYNGNSDPDFSNNYANDTTVVANPCPPVFTSVDPPDGSTGVPTSGTITWTSSNAQFYNIYLGPAGTGCTTLFGSTTSPSIDYSLAPATVYEYRIDAISSNCPTTGTTDCLTFTTGGSPCSQTAPAPLAPLGASTVSSPVTFSWSSVPQATGYIVTTVKNGVNDSQTLGSSTTTTTKTLSPGAYQWFVQATFANCPNTVSSRVSFIVRDPVAICSQPPRTLASVVGESTTGEIYHLFWDEVPTLSTFEVQEATNPDFVGATTQTLTGTKAEFQHDASTPTPYYYRVRAICSGNAAEYSKVVRTVIIPKPDPRSKLFELTTENGNTFPIRFSIFIPVDANAKTISASTFTIVSSAPWLTVFPGPATPSGLTLAAAVNPAILPVGTSTATVTATSNGTVIANPAVSLTLATPITPAQKSGPPANALLIPAVANVQGQKSKWQSDIRMTNLTGSKLTYQLTYTPSAVDAQADSKITSFDVKSGETIALDDIVKHLYGLGSLADGTNGVLEFHPLNFNGKFQPLRFNLGTFASSRTYNIGEEGSVGQFIPAIPYVKFIGSSAAGSSTAPKLSMQAIAQNANYRTNLGIVEGSGQPADVSVKVFDDNGTVVRQFGISIKAGEHQQLNSILAAQNVTLDDGRIELQVTTNTGKIMAYASVVDTRSNDPQLVPAVDITTIRATRYVLAGVTDFTSQFTKFRSDVRIFNAGSSSVDATLTFYPETGGPIAKSLTIGAGKIAALNSIIANFFGVTNAGGSMTIDTATESSLVATARTYDEKVTGTVGQFIPGVTADDAIAKSDRPLQILQVEQSSRFRTNVGVAEVSGKPVTVEVTASLPDVLTSPVITMQLQGNQFKQLNSVLKQMGLDNQFNARISVKVISGDGKVTAYGSVVDNVSQDPTYVPAQ